MLPQSYEPSSGTRIVAHIVYGLHSLSILAGLLTGATIAGAFIFSWPSVLAVILNYAGVLIFVGLTAYDTQKIKQLVEYASATGDEEQTTKLALMGSLTLYLDFINLFLYLLRIFGRRR